MTPTTMQALLYDRPATDTSGTAIRAVPIPRLGHGQVLLQVTNAGLNFKDVMARRGDAGYVDAWPFIPGLEAAGRVVALGPGVTDLRIGDRVAALTNAGALAQYAVARADLAAIVPDALDMAQAAAAPGALTTAALLIEHIARVRDGDVILVHSAAGAVGTALSAIAGTRAGVTLVGTVGDDTRVAAARTAGYDTVLVRGPQLADRIAAAVGDHGVDIVFDPQGTSQLDTDLAVLSPGGRIVVFGNAGGGTVGDAPSVSALVGANAAVGGFSLATLSAQRPGLIAATIASILRRLADGSLHLEVTEVPGLDHVAAAQQSLAAGNGATKYVARLDLPRHSDNGEEGEIR